MNLENPEQVLLSIQFVFTFVVLQNTAFLLFVTTFPSTKSSLNKLKTKLYIAVSFAIGLMALAGLFFDGYEIGPDDEFKLIPAPLIALFMLHAAFSIGWGVTRLVSRYRHAVGALRNQLLFLITASVLLLILVPLTNFFLPIVFKNNTFVNASPIYTSLFAGIISYAIIKQKLFDIRLVVARSAAYALVLITLGVTYGSVIFVISRIVVGESFQESNAYLLLNVGLVVLLAFSFQPIKRFFDTITNEIFYRDAYNTQEVLDKLGDIVVAEIDLHRILAGTRHVLTGAIRCNFIEFILFENNKPELHLVGHKALQENLEKLTHHIREQKREIAVAEELSIHNPLKEAMIRDGIAVSLRLKTQKQLVGYVLLGEKRSGEIYTSQDIALLTIVANELSITIQNALRFEEIQQFNITLRRKIDEATHELRRVNARLRELDKTKDEFISMASHQLRTPLTAVKGYLSMILEGDTGAVKKDQREMIQRSYDGAQKMVYLIADMLNVSRLQTGKFVIENKPTNLPDLVQGEVDQLREEMAQKKITLNFKKPASFPVLNLDETKIRQVVMNFLDNALYYTPSGGQIDIKLEQTAESVSYTITDTGVGVPKSVQHNLFSKFYRADNARKLRPDGTGLGLYMAKKVVTAQGGAIIFKSEEGKGSTFGFSFPLKTTEVSGGK